MSEGVFIELPSLIDEFKDISYNQGFAKARGLNLPQFVV